MILKKQKVPKSSRRVTKSAKNATTTKNAKKCPQVQKSVEKAGFHIIGAAIRTHQESRCLPYEGFFLDMQCIKGQTTRSSFTKLAEFIWVLLLRRHLPQINSGNVQFVMKCLQTNRQAVLQNW